MKKTQKTKLYILCGGRSGEHEISLKSTASVISALDTKAFEITVIGITKKGKFATPDEVCSMLPASLIDRVQIHDPSGTGSRGFSAAYNSAKKSTKSYHMNEIFFPLLHGPYGEDGTIQGFLEIADVPYIGCGVLASSLGMDKDVMKRLFLQAGMPVVPFRTVYTEEFRKNPESVKRSVSRELGYPMFSKPANLGSSVGIRKIHSEKEFVSSVEHSALFDRKIILEKGLDARELECAVLGNRNAETSVVGEIIPANEFYDYDAKYLDPSSRLEIPAHIDAAKSRRIQDLALRAFKTIEGSGLSRVDFFLERKTGKIWVSEINTMPGFTPISMYAKLWASSGVTFTQLVQKLIELGHERFSEKNQSNLGGI